MRFISDEDSKWQFLDENKEELTKKEKQKGSLRRWELETNYELRIWVRFKPSFDAAKNKAVANRPGSIINIPVTWLRGFQDKIL